MEPLKFVSSGAAKFLEAASSLCSHVLNKDTEEMPNPITATIAGVLLFDAAARVIASVGVGSDPRLNSLTADQA